jgi:hypothetical protein
MLLSALLGTLGSVSLMAQSTNVYSLNAVGYINVTIPTNFSVVSCPLLVSPDNSLNTLFPASNAAFKGIKFYLWTNGTYAPAASYTTHWLSGGTDQLSPGTAGFMFNPTGSPITVTFVGTVPSGTNLLNALPPGFTLVSSILPVDGILTNGLLNFTGAHGGDKAYVYNNATGGYEPANSTKASGQWITAPNLPQIGGGFFYLNGSATTNESWVESFSVGQ